MFLVRVYINDTFLKKKSPQKWTNPQKKTTKTAWEKTDRPRDDLLQCFDCSLSLHDPAGNDLENRPHFRHMRNLETIRNVLFSLPWFFENWEHGKTMDFARAMCLCQFFFRGNNDVFFAQEIEQKHMFFVLAGKTLNKTVGSKICVNEWSPSIQKILYTKDGGPTKIYTAPTTRQKNPCVSQVKLRFFERTLIRFHT